jgi:hypothetical protein
MHEASKGAASVAENFAGVNERAVVMGEASELILKTADDLRDVGTHLYKALASSCRTWTPHNWYPARSPCHIVSVSPCSPVYHSSISEVSGNGNYDRRWRSPTGRWR